MRNILAKVPEEVRAEFRTGAKAAYQALSPKLAQVLRDRKVGEVPDFPFGVRSGS